MATGDRGLPFVFTEEEVQQELARLGITNIDKESLHQFRNELQDLIQEVSASSAGFPDISSTSAGIGSGTCSDMSTTTTEEEKKMAQSPQSFSSRSPLSIPSPLLTPPLGKNDSHVPISFYKKFPDEPEKSYNNTLGHVRTAWQDPTGPPPPKTHQFGRIRQVNINYGSKQPVSSIESSTAETQRPGHISLTDRDLQDVYPLNSVNLQKKAFIPAFQNDIADEKEIKSTDSDTADHRLRNKENAMTHSRPFTTLLPTETKKEEPVSEMEENSNGLLDELLRIYKTDKPTENVTVPAKKFTKRKIVRKDADGKSYVDESYTESDSGSLLDPGEYLERLREMNKSIYDIAASDKESYFYRREPFSVTDYRPKSVILAPTTPPKLKKNKKSDPVNRYHQFRDFWALHKVPGENKHSDLRWYIKERMLHHDQIESRPRKVYVPNNYVVPTEKHRSSLRWQIRTDLAYGFMPFRDNPTS